MKKRIFILEGLLANKVTPETVALALQKLYNGKDTELGLSVEEITGKKIKYMKTKFTKTQLKEVEIIPKEYKKIYID